MHINVPHEVKNQRALTKRTSLIMIELWTRCSNPKGTCKISKMGSGTRCLNILYVLLSDSCNFDRYICHFDINLTEAGVMHEAGYVYSIWST